LEKTVLRVEGMSCNHCKMAVENAVRDAGAEGAVDLAGGIVTVNYNPAQVELDTIIARIEEEGYNCGKINKAVFLWTRFFP